MSPLTSPSSHPAPEVSLPKSGNMLTRMVRRPALGLPTIADVLGVSHNVALALATAHGRIYWTSNEFSELTGRIDLIGKPWDHVLPEADRQSATCLFDLATEHITANGTVTIARRGGQHRAALGIRKLSPQHVLLTLRPHDQYHSELIDLEKQASTDALSGLANRKAFFHEGDQIISSQPPADSYWSVAHIMLRLRGEGWSKASIDTEENLWSAAAQRIQAASGHVFCARTAAHQLSLIFATSSPEAAHSLVQSWVRMGYNGHDPGALWQPHIGVRAGLSTRTTQQNLRQLAAEASTALAQSAEKAWGTVSSHNKRHPNMYEPEPIVHSSSPPQLRFGTQILAASGDPTHVVTQLAWSRLAQDSSADRADGTDGAVVNMSCRSLRAAMSHVRAWRSARFAHVGLVFPVAEHLLSWPGFVDYVQRSLTMSTLPPGAVTLSFAAESLHRQSPLSYTHLRQVRDLGLRVAVDCGADNAAFFDCLREFAVDEVIFDVASVLPNTSTRTVTLLSSLVGLIDDLGARCVVDGVADVEHVKILQRIGVYRIGGSWCSPVTDIDDIPEVLVGLTDRARRYRDGEEVFDIPHLMQGADSATIDLTQGPGFPNS